MTFDNDRQNNNYTMAKIFLKEARLWQLWKYYIYDLAVKQKKGNCVLPSIASKNGKWWDVAYPHDVFGKANFTDYIEKKGIRLNGYSTISRLYDSYLHLRDYYDIEKRKEWLNQKIHREHV